jgi:Fe-Mn family superoxide dismutase
MNLDTQVVPYTPKKWQLSGLRGISDDTLGIHFGLYEGYVTQTNVLNERIAELRSQGKNTGADPTFAELVRRLGWEFNGMRLHEYYFDNLTTSPHELRSGRLYDLLCAGFDGFDGWKKDFAAVGNMRGIGWAVACYDPNARQMINVWVGDHNLNNLAGCEPIVVMDLWEHAYLRDYKPPEKARYVDAFIANIDWETASARLA